MSRSIDSRSIRLIVTDVDGVWTDGRIIYVGDQRETKEFNVRDGLGIKLAQRSGIRVAVLTSRRSRALERRCRELGIASLTQGVSAKLEAFLQICDAEGIPPEESCFIGDDLPDLGPMARAGLSAAPSDAVSEVLHAADWKLERAGGAGVIRELIERLLRERGLWDDTVREFTA